MVDSEQIEEWADEVYASIGKETTWSIAQVRCPEEGCPPVETVITDLSVKAPKPGAGVYKVLKAFADVTKEDVQQALCTDNGHGHGTHGHGGHGESTGHSESHGESHGHSEACCSGHGESGGHGGHGAHGDADHSGHGH